MGQQASLNEKESTHGIYLTNYITNEHKILD